MQGTGHDLNFQNETDLTYESKSLSIFIQTDKATYKPGQTGTVYVVFLSTYSVVLVTRAIRRTTRCYKTFFVLNSTEHEMSTAH